MNIFEERCKNDPQGVIKDLIEQTARQCNAICQLNLLLEGILNVDEAKFILNILSDESKPDESKPDESKPDESKPDESKPDESKPDESKPDDMKTRLKKAMAAIIKNAEPKKRKEKKKKKKKNV